MIKAVIFDWGGVLIDDPSGGLVRYCAAKLSVDEAPCVRIFERYLPAFQLGTVNEETFWQQVCGDLDREVPQGSLWNEAFGAVCQPREAMYDLARRLGENYHVAALSNTEVPAVAHFLAHRADVFAVKVFSCDEGLIKPDGALFKRCAQRMDVAAEETVLIDDRADNVAGARSIGMQAILFEDYDTLLEQLTGLGLDCGRSDVAKN